MIATEFTIDPEAIYPLHVAAATVGIQRGVLIKALKQGALLGNKRSRTWFIAGRDLQAWLVPQSNSRRCSSFQSDEDK